MVNFIENIGDPNKFLKKLVGIAIKKNVSDIHINCMKDKYLVRFRQTGELFNFCQVSADSYKKLLNIIKISSDMDVGESRHPQDGKIGISVEVDGKIRGVNLRVSTLPTIYGENIVIRILMRDKSMLDVDKLGFSKRNSDILNDISRTGDGVILVCGGTGSGKTTTIYSLLSKFNPYQKTIFTLEDPVEYQVEGYIQSQVRDDEDNNGKYKNYTFDEGLTGILRQDPDIILVGEIRSKNTAATCLEAGNTGHLVFTTLHSNSALGAISRLKQLGIPPYLISAGLKYIINQKLVRKLCSCHIKKDLTKIVGEKTQTDTQNNTNQNNETPNTDSANEVETQQNTDNTEQAKVESSKGSAFFGKVKDMVRDGVSKAKQFGGAVKKDDILDIDPNKEMFKNFQKKFNIDKLEFGFVNEAGCEKCNNGYEGMVLVSEVIKIDENISDMLLDPNKTMVDIREYLEQNDFVTIYEDALLKSLYGEVDFNDAISLKL